MKCYRVTNGKSTDFGGQFEKLVEMLSNKEDFNRRYMSREKLSKKRSYLLPDIQKIDSYLVRRKLELSSRTSWKTKEIDKKTLTKAYRKIAISNSEKIAPPLNAKADSYDRSQHEYMKKKAIEMATFLSPNFINISYDHPSNNAFTLDEETLIDFLGGSVTVSSLSDEGTC
jgi:hypothetical protein